MSERMTVVFDDPALVRQLKVWAAEHDTTLKQVIQEAVRAFLGTPDPEARPFDWDAFDRWQDEAAQRDRELPADVPTDLSNVKEHLYRISEPRFLAVAEEPEPYKP